MEKFLAVDCMSLILMLLAAIWLVLYGTDPFDRKMRKAALGVLALVLVFYTYWRWNSTIPDFSINVEIVWIYLFFLTELVTTIYTFWQCICLTKHSSRSLDSSVSPISGPDGNPMSVDLYIPTVSEPKEVLEKTITSATSINYPDLTIWVCDDGARNWLKRLCERLGVRYLNRPLSDPNRTKGGNLAWCIPHGEGDFVACLDADFQAKTNFVVRLTALLKNPEVGLVQAPQHFRNRDAVQRNLHCEDAWVEEQRFFFDIALPARDAWNNALCVGSCWVARRSTIDSLGGFPCDSIVEDVYFGYMVKSLGLKTVYLNECLATGLAAEDVQSYVNQRSRWCAGAMSLVTAPHGPFRAKNLSLIDRIFYAEIPFYWLTHWHLLMLLIAPILYGYFGFHAFVCTIDDLFEIILPKSILIAAVFYWLSQGRCLPIITPVQRTLPIFNVFISMVKGLFMPSSLGFTVTRKGKLTGKQNVCWNLAFPFIILGVLTLMSVVKISLQNFNELSWTDYSAYNAMLTGYSILTIMLCCLLSIDRTEILHNEGTRIPQVGSIRLTLLTLGKRVFTAS